MKYRMRPYFAHSTCDRKPMKNLQLSISCMLQPIMYIFSLHYKKKKIKGKMALKEMEKKAKATSFEILKKQKKNFKDTKLSLFTFSCKRQGIID